MEKPVAIKVDGYVENGDGTPLGWGEFIEKIESVGLMYGGSTTWVDTNGEFVPGIESTIKRGKK